MQKSSIFKFFLEQKSNRTYRESVKDESKTTSSEVEVFQ